MVQVKGKPHTSRPAGQGGGGLCTPHTPVLGTQHTLQQHTPHPQRGDGWMMDRSTDRWFRVISLSVRPPSRRNAISPPPPTKGRGSLDSKQNNILFPKLETEHGWGDRPYGARIPTPTRILAFQPECNPPAHTTVASRKPATANTSPRPPCTRRRAA